MKNYHELQAALNIAASSNAQSVLVDELHSPSTFFTKKVCRELSKTLSDDQLVHEVMTAVPFVRKRLLHAIMRRRRTALLDRLFPQLLKAFGFDDGAAMLHACSSSTVSEAFYDERLYDSRELRWCSICRHHAPVIVELIERDLKRSEVSLRSRVWHAWSIRLTGAVGNLQTNTQAVEKLFDLWLRLAPRTWAGPGGQPLDDSERTGDGWRLETVSLLNWWRVAKCCPERLFEHVVHSERMVNHQRPFIVQYDIRQALFQNKNFCQKWLDEFDNVSTETRSAIVGAMSTSKFFEHQRTYVFPKLLADKPVRVNSVQEREASHAWRRRVSSAVSTTTTMINCALRRVINRGEPAVVPTDKQRSERTAAAALACEREQANAKRIEALTKHLVTTQVKPIILEMMKLDGAWRGIKDSYGWNSDNQIFTSIVSSLADLCPEELLRMFWKQAQLPGNVLDPFDESADLSTTQVQTWHTDYSTALNQFKTAVVKKSKLTGETESWGGKTFEPRSEFEMKADRERRSVMWTWLKEIITAQIDADLILYNAYPKTEAQLLAHLQSDYIEIRDLMWSRLPDAVKTKLAKSAVGGDFSYLKLLSPSNRHELTRLALACKPNPFQQIELLAFLPLTEDHNRAALEKTTDSPSAADRRTALCRLLNATYATEDLGELVRTLELVRSKVKNEAESQRQNALSAISCRGSASYRKLFPELGSPALFAAYEGLLDDMLESGEDSAGSIQSLLHATHQALIGAVIWTTWAAESLRLGKSDTAKLAEQQQKAKALFAFAGRVQYRHAVFLQGASGAANTFKLSNLPRFKTAAMARAAIPLVFEALKELLPKETFEKRTDEFWEWLFNQCETGVWADVPELCDWLSGLIDVVEKTAPRDADSLIIANKRGRMMKLLNSLLDDHPAESTSWFSVPTYDSFNRVAMLLPHRDCREFLDDAEVDEERLLTGVLPVALPWPKVPLLCRFVDVVMHSRAVLSVLPRWRSQVRAEALEKAKLAKTSRLDAIRAANNHVVETMLDLSKSAIHSRLVWRHLVRHRQDLLNDFVDADACQAFRGVFYVPPSRRSFVKTEFVQQAREYNEGDDAGEARFTRSNLVQRQNDDDENMRKEFTPEKDHPELYVLEACYGLRRLLPRHVDELKTMWYKQIFNPNRAMPERLASARRYTLMPTTSFTNIVSFIENEAERVPGSIVDVMFRGLLQGDERLAPLRYLFSRKVLAGDRITAAMAASAAVINILPSDGLTSIIEAVFNSGVTRVTVLKNAARILLMQPVKGVPVALKQWRKKSLHRDVRITMLKVSLRMLSQAKHSSFAWKIVDAAVESRNTELLIALLGATNGSIAKQLPALVERPRLRRYLETLPKVMVPVHERATYVEHVLLPLLKADERTHSDVSVLAAGVLGTWAKFFSSAEKAVELLFEVVRTIEPRGRAMTSLNMDASSKQTALALARVYQAARNIIKLCGCSHYIDFKPAKREHVKTLFEVVSAVAMNCKGPIQRSAVVDVLMKMLNQLPENGVLEGKWNADEEKQFMAPLSNVYYVHGYEPALASKLLDRRTEQLNLCGPEEAKEECLSLLKDLLMRQANDEVDRYHSVQRVFGNITNRHEVVKRGLEFLLANAHVDKPSLFEKLFGSKKSDKEQPSLLFVGICASTLLRLLQERLESVYSETNCVVRKFVLEHFGDIMDLIMDTPSNSKTRMPLVPRFGTASSAVTLANLLTRLVNSGSQKDQTFPSKPLLLVDAAVKTTLEALFGEAIASARHEPTPRSDAINSALTYVAVKSPGTICQLGTTAVEFILRMHFVAASTCTLSDVCVTNSAAHVTRISALLSAAANWHTPIAGSEQQIRYVAKLKDKIAGVFEDDKSIKKSDVLYRICMEVLANEMDQFFVRYHTPVVRTALVRAWNYDMFCAEQFDAYSAQDYYNTTKVSSIAQRLQRAVYRSVSFDKKKPKTLEFVLDLINWLLDEPDDADNVERQFVPLVMRQRCAMALQFLNSVVTCTRDAKTRALPDNVAQAVRRAQTHKFMNAKQKSELASIEIVEKKNDGK